MSFFLLITANAFLLLLYDTWTIAAVHGEDHHHMIDTTSFSKIMTCNLFSPKYLEVNKVK
jgi:hypothetical protein